LSYPKDSFLYSNLLNHPKPLIFLAIHQRDIYFSLNLYKNNFFRKLLKLFFQEKNIKKLFSFFLLFLFLFGCEFDQGLGPLNSKISGQLVYFGSEFKPANIGEVRVAALLNFPPSGLNDIIFSDPLEFNSDTVDYELYLPVGEYRAIVVLWKASGENWSFNSLLGLYGFAPPDQFELRGLSITKENPILENVNLFALWSFANTSSKISGEIVYHGVPPADTEGVLLIAFTQIPNFNNLLLSLLYMGGMPLPLSTSGNSVDYQLQVFFGEYKYIGAFWKGVNTPLEELVPIGFYPDILSPKKPGSFIAPDNGIVYDINFIADFNTLPDGIYPE
jgi:hypothetical protein